ncbi:Uncharacterized protein DBV15_07779, partial [Temnothorax longispinosus]
GALANVTISTEALSIFRQSTRGHEIIDMPLYREFCGDVVAVGKTGVRSLISQ